jgi:glycogen operon protein
MSLRYWVAHDARETVSALIWASVLSRDLAGQPLEDPPILSSIESDPILAGTQVDC